MAITKVSRGLLSTGIDDQSNATAITIDSSENVGIGTTNPQYAKLHVENTSGNTALKVGTATQGVFIKTTGVVVDYNASGNVSGEHAFSTGNTERMRIDVSGNVLQGTTTQAGNAALTVKSSAGSNTGIMIIEGDTNDGWGLYSVTSDDSFRITQYTHANTYSDKLIIDSSGNVITGSTTANASDAVTLRQDGTAHVNNVQVANGGGSVGGTTPSLYSPASATLAISTNSTERMRIDGSGSLLVGGTSSAANAEKLAVLGGSSTSALFSVEATHTTAFGPVKWRNGNGEIGSISFYANSVSYNTSSDYRLKENVDYTWDATTRLKQLKPARFNFIADADTLVDGFLAHEVSGIVPEAITGEKDAVDSEGNPEYQGIDQSKLVPLLVKTIQELEARITTLEG